MNKVKKAQFLYTEAVLWAVIAVLIGVMIFIMQSKVDLTTTQTADSVVPKLYDEYPSVVLTTFIHLPLTDTEILAAGLKGDKVFRVEDLIKANSKESLAVFQTKRQDFLDNFVFKKLENSQNTYFDYYLSSSGESTSLSEDTIIVLSDSLKEIPSLKTILDEHNFYYVFTTQDKQKRVLFFKTTSQQLVAQNIDSATSQVLGNG